MKRFMKSAASIMLLLLLVVCVSCNSNKQECTGVIIVSMVDTCKDDCGVKMYIPNVELKIGDSTFNNDVKRTVYTDQNGLYEGTWKNEAYLRVEATRMIANKMHQGVAFIRLSSGDRVEQEILLKEI